MKKFPVQPPSADITTGDERVDDRVAAAAQEYLAALESGQCPSRDEFVARYPDIAEELTACLEGLELVRSIAPQRSEPAPAPASSNREAAVPLGDFRLLREIGRGGMGVVYEALQLSLGRRVAVKVLPLAASLDPKHLQRFKNEAQAAAQLHHSNIVPVYAVGVERGVHFYAMQLVEGQSLACVVRHLQELAGNRRGKYEVTTAPIERPAGDSAEGEADWPDRDSCDAATQPELAAAAATARWSAESTGPTAQDITRGDRFRRAADWIRQAATAIEHAHQCGVIHRDLKPANLLVDQRGNLWVTDFGLAHIQADVALTRTGDMVGTLRYMSPEQAAGDRIVLDHRTDIYSLGVTFYELLTLEPVFAEVQSNALLKCILEEEPHAPRALNKDIPAELETIVLKAIAKTPAERYATAQQLADDLQRWLDDKPIQARRPRLRERVARWQRRHRTAVRWAGAFGVLAFLGLAASTVLISREHAQTKVAYQQALDERAAAERSFQQARQAVDTFVQMGEEELADNPSTQALRRQFLETALAYYGDFLDQRQDDPAVRAELAASSERVREIIDELAALEGLAPLALLSDERVQQDLGLSAAQSKETDTLLALLDIERDQLREPDDSIATPARQQTLARLARSYEQQVREVLSPQQAKRLKQISWQQQAPFVFRNPEIVALLNLTPQQRKQVSQIIAEESPAGRGRGRGSDDRRGDGLPPPPPDDRGGSGPPPRRGHHDDDGPPGHGPGGPGYGPKRHGEHGPPDHGRPDRGPGSRESMRETMNRTTSRILESLSAEQRTKWNELTGEPFAFDLRRQPEAGPPK